MADGRPAALGGAWTRPIGWALGLGLLGWVAWAADWSAVGHALAAIGWGIVAIAILRFVPIGMDALGWRRFVGPRRSPSFPRFLWARWIGESVNTLLPALQIGGDAVRAALLARAGAGGPRAAASVTADFVVGLFAQIAFAALGLAVLAAAGLEGPDGAGAFALSPGGTAVAVALGLSVAAALLAALVRFLGRAGISAPLARAAGIVGARPSAATVGSARRFERLLRALGRDRGRALGCFAWRFAGWFPRALETGLVLYWLGWGTDVGYASLVAAALVIESLLAVVRSAAFMVPGAIGVSEGGIVALGHLMGIPAEIALALALAKRGREVLTSAPGLLAWALAERRHRATAKGGTRSPAPRAESEPLAVAVTVDLSARADISGHVRCWRNLAAAAVTVKGLDLTVHMLDRAPGTTTLAPNVRIRRHRPLMPTSWLPWGKWIPGETDLCNWQPGFAKAARGAHVLHTTGAHFALAKTARRAARTWGVPLVYSSHSDVPAYAKLYTRVVLERMVGVGVAGRLLRLLPLDDWAEADARRALVRHWRASAFVGVSRDDEWQAAARVVGARRVFRMRRGIDPGVFSPARRDRSRVEAEFGIPAGRTLIVFAGRMDAGKNVLALAQAVAAVAAAGGRPFLLCAGDGPERARVAALLGATGACPGRLDPDAMGRAMASADLVAHPSEAEVFSNVVLEGLASGTPVAVSATSGIEPPVPGAEAAMIRAKNATAAAWAETIASFERDDRARRALIDAARALAQGRVPSWRDVLVEDLLPVWLLAAGSREATDDEIAA